jgi:hypothetical protein
MMADSRQNHWELGLAVEQARLRYQELTLLYPKAAVMARSGLPHQGSDDVVAEAENQQWRALIKAYGAIISQIWFASMRVLPPSDLQSFEPVRLEPTAEKAIAEIVWDNWRSVGRFAKYVFSDWKLEQHVEELVKKIEAGDRELTKKYNSLADRPANPDSWWGRTFNA